MTTYKVKLSDGDAEWWEELEARNDDHLFDIIDAEGWDVVSVHFTPSPLPEQSNIRSPHYVVKQLED